MEQALGAASALHPDSFNPMLTLKALSYFADGDLPELPAGVREDLAAAAATVGEIARVPRRANRLPAAGD